MLILALFLALLQPAPPAVDDQPVLLLTISPGELAWERFGHNALVVDGIAYDWGRFDFGQSTGEAAAFVGRFIQGDMAYGFGAADAELVADFYVNQLGRQLTITTLNLTPQQKDALRTLLAREPTTYQYDYFTDNCSTKLRDLLDETTGGALREALGAPASTYRREVSRHTAASWWLWPALEAGMGVPCDVPITAWEQSFIPGELDRHLDGVRVGGRPLVLSRRTVGTPTTLARQEPPFREPLMAGIGVFAGLALLGISRWKLGRFVAGLVAVLLGLGGSVVLYLWLFTGHNHAGPNASGLLLAPVSVLLGIALATRQPKMKQIAAVGVVLCILGGVTYMLITGQHAWSIALAAVPPQIAVAWIAIGPRKKAITHDSVSHENLSPDRRDLVGADR